MQDNELNLLSLVECQQRLQAPQLSVGERLNLLSRVAALLAAQGNYPDALYTYNRALDLSPTEPMLLYKRGVVLGQLGLYDEAIDAYNQALQQGMVPTAAFWIDCGDSLARGLKRYKPALESYNQAIALEPDNYHALSGRGFCLAMLGRGAEALVSCDRAIGLQPDAEEVWNSRGLVLYKTKRHPEALKDFDRAVAVQPGSNRTWYNRGMTLLQLHREAEAIESFETALRDEGDRYQPWYPSAWMWHGYGLMQLGRFEGAIASLDRALAYEPQNYLAALYRLVCLGLTGKIITHGVQPGTRYKLMQNLRIVLGFLKYRLLILVSLIGLLAWGRGAWIDRLKEILPWVMSALIVSFVVLDLWKNRSRLGFVWKTYFRSGVLAYVRALGILVATLSTYLLAESVAPPFLQWGWANLVFGQPGNILFQPFNLLQMISPALHSGAIAPLWATVLPLAIALNSVVQTEWAMLDWADLLILGFWLLLVLGIPFWARLEERIFRRGANTWRQIAVRSTQFGLAHLVAGIPILAGFVLIVPGFLFACRYKYVHDRHLRRNDNFFQAQEAGVAASTADHAIYNAILVTLLVVTVLTL